MKSFSPIAVVGEGCILPGAHNPDQLWNMVAEGQTSLSQPPEGHWRISMENAISKGGPGSYIKNKSWSSLGGYIHNFDSQKLCQTYESQLPGLESLDPLVQWSLYAAGQAIEGVRRPNDPSRVGLVMGNLSYPSVSMSRFAEQVWMEKLSGAKDGIHENALNRYMSGAPADLVSKALGLEGRAFALDAACASALYAIYFACQQLQDGTSDLVLAGAVNCTDPLFIHVGFCALSAMSKSGQSRPFHQNADGLIPAEGSAFVALKKLDKAVADGDNILGVIRGVGLSNDGRSGGLLSPSSAGQVKAMAKAYEMSGLSPDQVSFIECHATGTSRGDGTEVASMKQVYAHRLPISSLKSNIGHSITASGVAGLIKVLHGFKERIIPTTPNAYPLADHIADSSFEVPKSNREWEGDRLLAAINSFGFGGNNAHMLVEEWRDTFSYVPPVADTAKEKVCLVACQVKTHNSADYRQFSDRVKEGTLAEERTEEAASIDIRTTGFPPKVLQASLGQQLLALELAQTAAGESKNLGGENLGVFLGMGADPEICRYGLRARLTDILGETEETQEFLESIAPKLESEHVLGTMPNVVANRISSAFNAGGMSFSVSHFVS